MVNEIFLKTEKDGMKGSYVQAIDSLSDAVIE
jgi:hypothetical protein